MSKPEKPNARQSEMLAATLNARRKAGPPSPADASKGQLVRSHAEQESNDRLEKYTTEGLEMLRRHNDELLALIASGRAFKDPSEEE